LSSESYLIAWAWYLGASVALLWCVWRVSARLPVLARQPVRAFLAALMLVPWTVKEGHEAMAPAWLVILFDAVMQDDSGALRAGKPLLAAALLVLVVALVNGWLRRRRLQEATGG
jgi:hypothetical protein